MNIKKLFLVMLGFISSLFSKETFHEFLNDNRGGLVLSFGDIDYKDAEWIEYKLLRPDRSVKSVNPCDLPDEFCDEACRVVDEFHRKTVNQDVEWMLYFDYKTGEVVYCWKGDENNVAGDYIPEFVSNRHIASIHNHPSGVYSFPSPDNFGILSNDFEDFEIITSVNAFWIVEFKGNISFTSKELFSQDLSDDMSSIISEIRLIYNFNDVDNVTEEDVAKYLLNKVDKQIQGINLVLIKKEYD